MSLALFDSHGGLPPGPAGQLGQRVAAYARAAAAAGFSGGCVQAMPGQEAAADFMAAVRDWPGLLPVPAWPAEAAEAPEAVLDRLARLGATALHLHPRACGLSPEDPRLGRVLRGAAARDLVVFYCTYAFAPVSQRLPLDPLPGLARAMAEAPGLRLVLLHGGGVDLLRHAEFVRANPGTLLDLSFTLMKYAGSSIDLDLAFLCRSFDRRICLGTDFPDYAPDALAARFQALCGSLPMEKRRNIAAGNLRAFLKLPEGEGAMPPSAGS